MFDDFHREILEKCKELPDSTHTHTHTHIYIYREREREIDRKCVLSFGAESFVFQVAIQKFKD